MIKYFLILIVVLFFLGCNKSETSRIDNALNHQSTPPEDSPEQKREKLLAEKMPIIFSAAIKDSGIRDGTRIDDLRIERSNLEATLHFTEEQFRRQNVDYDMQSYIGKINSSMLVEALVKKMIEAGINPRVERIGIQVCSYKDGLKTVTGAEKSVYLGCSFYSPGVDDIQ